MATRKKIKVKPAKSVRIREVKTDPKDEKIKILVAGIKSAKEHLDLLEGGLAWDVLDETLEEAGEK